MQDQVAHCDLGVETAQLSDIGLRRSNNQDSMTLVLAPDHASWRKQGHLFIVADGMGAHAAGELASKLAVDNISLNYQKFLDEPPPVALRMAIKKANETIHHRGQANAEFAGMGTTVTTLLLLPQGAVVGHVGDSRAYRLRGNQLEQLSFDHSLVWEMMQSGKVGEDDVPAFVPRNVITRSLGPNPVVDVDLEGPFPLEVGDTFLLCSDGLSGQVKDEEIGMILATLPPQEAIRLLVDLANLRGGPDNITVIVARVADERLTRERGESWDIPVTDEAAKVDRPTRPVEWIVVFALFFLTVVLALSSLLVPAAAAVVATFVATLYVLRHKLFTDDGPLRMGRGQPLGRGPYRAFNCSPNQAFTDRLAKTVQELNEAAKDEEWEIDWEAFNAARKRATEAINQRRFDEGIREYAHAIIFMMAELRKQSQRRE